MRLRCARCNTERLDTHLNSFFLCEECTAGLTNEALNGTQPIFRDFVVLSYCGLCNEHKELHLTQWFLCPYCDRLVNSYRLGRVSQAFAQAEWDRLVRPVTSRIALEVKDIVSLSPYQRPRKKRSLATELDFLGKEGDQAVFWVELKTGQRSIDEMVTFQLDCSDCDDILNVVALTGLPAYVFHVHLGREYHPPSFRILTHGIWWTDIFAMAEAFQETERRRRNGGKLAAHFSKECFQTLGSLGPALSNDHHVLLRERLQEHGMPRMYRINE